MAPLWRTAEAVLRGDPVTGPGEGVGRAAARLAACQVAFGALYGAVMGSFGGFAGDRGLQVIASAVKVPFLLVATTLLSLPSFFVVNTLLGLRADIAAALRAIASAQAALTVALASLAPVTALWYVTSRDYRGAILFNAFMFGLAAFGAQARLRRGYRPLLERDGRHRLVLRAWLVVFALVGIQMGWLMRPFIGSPDAPFQLFRPDTWGNAYEFVFDLMASKLS